MDAMQWLTSLGVEPVRLLWAAVALVAVALALTASRAIERWRLLVREVAAHHQRLLQLEAAYREVVKALAARKPPMRPAETMTTELTEASLSTLLAASVEQRSKRPAQQSAVYMNENHTSVTELVRGVVHLAAQGLDEAQTELFQPRTRAVSVRSNVSSVR